MYSSLARTRSRASTRICRWSKASSGASSAAAPVGREQVVDDPPAGVGGVGAGGRLREVGRERDVGDRHHPHPRVAVGRGVGAQLLEVAGELLDPGLLVQLAPGRLLGVLVRLDEAAGQGPLPGVRLLAALDQQHRQGAVADGEDREVDGDRERRVAVAVDERGTRLPDLASAISASAAALVSARDPGVQAVEEPYGEALPPRVERGRPHAVVGGDPGDRRRR